jgi:tyramine---L-glutamate ligase
MRILVYEHLTAGGYSASAPSLVQEGDAMLKALLEDLCAMPGTQLFTLRDERLHRNLPCEVSALQEGCDWWSWLRQAIKHCDAVWPIAPETGGWLERITEEVLNQGRLLLNSGLEAVRITSSKWRTSQVLHAAGIPVVPTYHLLEDVPQEVECIVAKPDDGAGCVDTFILRGRGRTPLSTAVFQPYIDGDPRSFAMHCSNGDAVVLCVNKQIIEEHGGALKFMGVQTGAFGDADGELARLARRILAAIPDLYGFVGVDYVQTKMGPVVIEINPRLTCAYVGMSERLGFNVAQRLVRDRDWRSEESHPASSSLPYFPT